MHDEIEKLSVRFASDKTEAAYQAFINEGDCANNFRVLLIALPLFPLYGLFDYLNLSNPAGAILLRVGVSAVCFLLLLGYKTPTLQKYQQWLTFAVVFMLGASINAINYFFGDLSNSYHIALVQGFVFACFLLRISFFKTIALMASFVAVYIPAAYAMPDPTEASVHSIVLITMMLVCGIGSYLFQRFRRQDFQKVLTIERQNEQLTELLKNAEEDNERKIAALNMLVHFIKTPLHQITGFSDILVSAMSDTSNNESAENARYIKNATVSLTKSINGLLNYHRLDEAAPRATPERVNIACIIDDFSELLPSSVSLSKGEIAAGAVSADPEILRAALDGFADHYRDERTAASRLVVSAESAKGDVVITLRDDAGVLSSAQYEDLVQPLTQMQGYLSHTGDEMPMALRTVARAIEISGGDMVHTALADGNRYQLTLLAAEKRASAAA